METLVTNKSGEVCFVKHERGWGKIRLRDTTDLNGIEVFFHIRHVDGKRQLEIGTAVRFDLLIKDTDKNKYDALNVIPMSGVECVLSGFALPDGIVPEPGELVPQPSEPDSTAESAESSERESTTVGE